MSASAKPVEKVFKSLLAVILAISLCPLMPADKAQAQEAGDSGELAASAQIADEGRAEAIDSDSENSASTVESSFVNNSGISLLSDDSGTPIADWKASGKCEWMIDADGRLVIRPQSGKSEGWLASWGDSKNGFDPPWEDFKNFIRSVRIEKGVVAPTCLKMFQNCPNLTTADLNGLDVSKASRMDNMFEGCPMLASLDLTSFDTSNATDMDDMFVGCSSLTSLDLSSFDTSKVENMEKMFSGCSSLTSLDLTSFDTSKVWGMRGMFYGCSSLTSLDLTSFDTSNVTTMMSMFEKCESLASLDMSSFDMSSSPYMYATFWGCKKLHSVKLGSKFKFDTKKAGGNSTLPTPSGAGLTGCWIKEGDEAGKTYTSSDIYWLARGYDDPSGLYYAQGTLESAELSVNTEPEKYTGFPITKTISSPSLVEDVDYVVEYSSNIDVGEAHLTIKGIGGCAGKQEHSFRILQADPAFEAPSGLAATYGQTLADVALPGGFSWQEDASTPVGAVGDNGFHVSFTPADQRNYRTVRDIPVTVSVSPAKVETPALKDMTFDGTEQTVPLPSSDLFTASGDFSGRNVGLYDVVFSLNDKSSYVWGSTESSADITVSYAITPADTSNVDVEPIPQQKWTGSEITPKPTLKIAGSTLQEGIDYTLDYENNVNNGTGIVIARSTGNISGDIEVPFEIVKSEEPLPAPDPTPQPQQYNITYHLDGGSNAPSNPTTYTAGIAVSLSNPTKEGFEFQGWFADSDFKRPIAEIGASSTGNVELWAKWSKSTLRPFPDVDYSSWYAPGVDFVQEKGLMTGYSDTGLFGVGKILTRAEFATIIWRHACPEEAATYSPATAKDETGIMGSADGMFYTAAANWTVKNGIITGYVYEDGTQDFAANDPVTFEQLVTILARFATNGAGADPTNNDLSAFADGNEASSWAAPSLKWAADNGLVEGYPTSEGKVLAPTENVLRERVAVVLMRAFKMGVLE